MRSLKNNRLYTGSTNNLERRIFEHNRGQSKYTKSTAPFKLVYKEQYESKSEAYNRELFLKTGKGREFLDSIINKRA